MKHKAISVPYLDGTVDIDEKIAPLIHGLWRKDIFTFTSCQGDDINRGRIGFRSSEDYIKFMNLIVQNNKDIRLLTGPKKEGTNLYDICWDLHLYSSYQFSQLPTVQDCGLA